MSKRPRSNAWTRLFQRSAKAIGRSAVKASSRAWAQALKSASTATAATATKAASASKAAAKAASTATPRPPARLAGSWTSGLALGPAGARRFKLFRPVGIARGERLPLMVMLHGCGQDANSFAASTRMNSVAQRERFLVLYPEQDRLANAQGCWNWFSTDNGRAFAEVALIINAIDQACLLHPVDRARVVIAGLSAGASMAALVAARHPGRFKAVVMHSGVAPGSAHSALSALGAMRGRRRPSALAVARVAPAEPWPPLLVIQGDADGVVAPRNGLAAAQVWAQAAGAVAGPPRRVQRGQRYPTQVTDFKHQGRSRVTLVEVQGLAHAWSGGAASQAFSDGLGPDASRMAWAFAARQLRLGERRLQKK